MKYAIVSLLVIHGLIHAMGFEGAWDLAEFQGASRTPTNLVTTAPGSGATRALGLVWLVALVAFLLAAVLLVNDSVAWRPAALLAAAISMVPVALWWQNAPMGAVANALVIAAVVIAPRLDGVAS
jgi:asparagine N-glycosylation enzyme membrane subunit Stt3